MARLRAAMAVGTLVTSAALAFGIANCASPTQIIVDVRADTSLCKNLLAGIAVTTLDAIDSDALEIYQKGCESGTDRVGTLTITPSGSKDDWVGVRIVAGTSGADPDQCGLPSADDDAPDWKNCILARRRVQFSAGKTVNLTVRLTSDCVGRYCGGNLECTRGVCVKESQVPTDGGIETPDPAFDAGTDAKPDASGDPCARCETGACANGVCIYDCTKVQCSNRTLCAPGLDCRIDCLGSNCRETRCVTDGTCTFRCGGVQRRCGGIACSAGTCNVTCEDAINACEGVHLDGGTNNVTCEQFAASTCNDVNCQGTTCTRDCADGGCGPTTTCKGNCDAWQDSGSPF